MSELEQEDTFEEHEHTLRQDSLLPRISVTRPVTVTMCLVALLVVGFVAYLRLPIQAFPSGWEWRWIWVSVDQPGMSPKEVDRSIRQPLEEMLRTVKGYRRIRAYSSSSWGLWMGLEFQPEADLDLAYSQMVDRVERAKLALPDETRDFVRIWKFNQETDWEIMWMGVSLPDDVTDPYRFAETSIRRPLERLKGVAKIEIWGADEREVIIEVDHARMDAHRINNFELTRALQQDNFALSGGYVFEGGKKFFVRSTTHFRSLEDIRNLPIRVQGRSDPDQRPARYVDVRLRDIASVEYKVPERRWFQKINGKSSIAIGVFRESGESIVDVCERVSGGLERIERATGTQFGVFFNQGKIVSDSIANLRNTGIWGGLFAAMILLYFLRTLRMTALITLSIPLCVMIALLGIYALDWSLNTMTMMGLMVGVGMVVDNAIVIVENIYRLRGNGEDPHNASVRGASEVGLAITMATLTTVVVFLPLILMSGNAEATFFLSKMGLPVVFSLLGSLFVALLFIPLAAKRFGDARIGKEPGMIRRTRGWYLHALSWALTHRRDAVILVLAVAATAVYPMNNMKSGGGDNWDASQNRVRVRVYGSPGFGFTMMDSVTSAVEEAVKSRTEAYGIRTIRTWYDDDYGQVQIFLNDPPNQEWWYLLYRNAREAVGSPVDNLMDRKMVIEDMNKILPRFVGAKLSVDKPIGREDKAIDVNFFGEDFDRLADLMEEAERRIRQIPSILSTESDLERGSGEIQVRIDRQQAHKFGLSAQNVGQTIATMVRGANLRRLKTDEREVDVRLQLSERDRQTLTQLKAFSFENGDGDLTPLSSFASFRIGQGVGTIRREDGRLRLRIRVLTSKEDANEVYTQIEQALEGFEMPRGYSWDRGESYSKHLETQDQMNFALLMAVTFVFLLMGVLFESVILPFSVILSIPLAFFGVYWTLWLTNTRMDDMANMGCVVLIGVVVNNAIVLVDMVNRMRAEGMDRFEAILEAGHNRYRPILMTTFTTVFGLLPMAVSTANMMGMPYAPLGRTMMGGLVASTFLTLVVVPLFYTLFDDFRLYLRELTAGAFGRKATAPAPLPADD